MKKLICLLTAILLLFLTACNDQTNPPKDTAETESATHEWTGETIPLITAKNGFVSNGYLYFIDNGWLNFTILESGQTQVLCFDPLCIHEERTSKTVCFALANTTDMESRVLVYDGKVWFTAKNIPSKPGDPTYTQLRSLDLNTMKLDIYLEKNELSITDFWFYGDELYLSMPTMKEQEDGSIYYAGGSIYRLDKKDKLTLVLEDADEEQFQLLSSGAGCIYYTGKFGDGTIYKTTPDFSYTEAVAVLPGVINIQFHDDYVYYQRRTENIQSAECPSVDGDFDENISITSYAHAEISLYRMKLNGTGTEEPVYASMPIPRNNAVLNHRNYHIDEETGLIYLVPLEVSCRGYTIWKPDSMMLQMGASGKDILTGYFSVTGGRLLAFHPNTLEIEREYTDLGVDILDIYSIKDGQIMGHFSSIDPAVLDEKGTGSQKIYEYFGLIHLK